MAQQSKIYDLRQTIGAVRQHEHAAALESLHHDLNSLGLEHPYALEREHIDHLMTNQFFAQGGRGLPASVSGPQFLYRICNIRKIVEYTSWIPANRYENNEDIWLNLKRDFDDLGDWIPLNHYARGELTGPRGFTWWTTLNFLTTNIICGAHSIGLPNDWLPKYAVVIRCPLGSISGINSLLVPTVLDAFDGEIFHPTISDSHPGAGLTISLEGPSTLNAGTDEFVLLDVDVESMEAIPVLIDRRMRALHSVQLDSGLRTLLEMYYKNL
jgi:hypothetical protein